MTALKFHQTDSFQELAIPSGVSETESDGIQEMCCCEEVLVEVVNVSPRQCCLISHKLEESALNACDVQSSNELKERFEVAHRPFTNDDIYNLVNKISSGQQIGELELRACGLEPILLKKLLSEIKNTSKTVKIDKLSITATDYIHDLLPIICEIMSECQTRKLSLEECTGDLKSLYGNLKKCKIPLLALDLSYIPDISLHHIEKLFSEIEELLLVNCDLKLSHFVNLDVSNSKVQYLDLSFNNHIDEDVIRKLPSLLSHDEPVTLILQGCDLSEDEMLGFTEFESITVERLDLSYNNTLNSEGICEVGRFAKLGEVEDISLSSCHIDETSIDSFVENLGSHKLKKLDLSRNVGVLTSPDKIASLLETSGIAELDLSDCRLVSSEIIKLSKSFQKRDLKLRKLNLIDHERMRIDDDYISSIDSMLEHTDCIITLTIRSLKDKDIRKMLDHFEQNERILYD